MIRMYVYVCNVVVYPSADAYIASCTKRKAGVSRQDDATDMHKAVLPDGTREAQ